MPREHYHRCQSVSSAEDDESRRRREKPRYPPSRERGGARDRKRHREDDSQRRDGHESRRRRSFSPLNDYNAQRGRAGHHRHASSLRVSSRSRSPPSPSSKPAISRRPRSRKNDAHRRSSPYRKPRDSTLSTLEKNNPTQDAPTTDTTANIEKQKPNYAPTGLLAAETNTVNGILLKYNEPPEARKPAARDAWRLYVFKGSDLLDTVHLGERSCWLFGREREVVDFPVDHPSCSKQHAVIQFRFVERKNEFGDRDGRVRPYILDLDSANGTFVNKDQIPVSRYVELRDKDMLQFGLSTREYVLMLPPDS